MRYLDIEEKLIGLDQKLKDSMAEDNPSVLKEIHSMEETIFKKLSDWDILKIARHPDRPHSLDYIKNICDENSFLEIHGDRMYADDKAIITGFATIEGRKVLIIGQQKGRDLNNKKQRNFGMPHPEGYRKALRVSKLAEQFQIPIIMLIDTPGAFPGIGAEERGQSEAIAKNLLEFSDLKTPTISLVIGEGGSGGALAIGIADKLAMLEYSTFSVISPEGCSNILWKDSNNVENAVKNLQITSNKLLEQNNIDEVLSEGIKPAHRYPKNTFKIVKNWLVENIDTLNNKDLETLLEDRYTKLRKKI